MGNDEGLELDETDEDEEMCDSDEEEVEEYEGECRDSLLYEQWATTRDLSWMRLMKRRACVRATRSKLRSTKARM